MPAKRLAYPPVAVFWHDAHESNEETTRSEVVHEPETQVTIGFLIRSDKVGVSLACEYNSDDPRLLRTTNFIPRGMVQRIVRLKG